MTIYLVVQENQNEHGYIDTTLLEAFTEERLAQRAADDAASDAAEDGEQVEGQEGVAAGEWTVCFKVQPLELYRAPITSVESQVYIDTGELPLLGSKAHA